MLLAEIVTARPELAPTLEALELDYCCGGGRSLAKACLEADDASYEALYAGLAELETDTHLHIHKGNKVLFPAAIAEEVRRIAQ